MSLLDPKALFHTGIIVDDLALAMKTLTEIAGYTWTVPMELEVTPRTASGVTKFAQRFALSIEEPRLELVEAIPGSVWQSNGANGAHHIGYWAEPDRINAISQGLVELGLPVEASNDYETDGALVWVYHRGLGGNRIELLNTFMKPMMEAWIGGADPATLMQGQ